ncbi:hypothetical protein ACP70R_030862 [Stipagrostis hirtigluma subsp. patula]
MSLEASVEARLSKLRAEPQQWRPPLVNIFRVPPFIRKGNPAAYKPCMLSIGPYYHGKDGLHDMEDHKWRYLNSLLSRGDPGLSTSLLIQEMRHQEVQVRSCYREQSSLDSDNFVQMLLLDGCFILEFFFKRHNKEPDVLYDVGWGLMHLTSDLLLLENQIPLFVIEKLYDTLTGVQGGSRKPLHNLLPDAQGHPMESLLSLFLEHISDKEPTVWPTATDEIQHLLHLYYISFVPRPATSSLALLAMTDSSVCEAATSIIPCATDLCEAGVMLELRRSARDMFDIEFDIGRGIIEIPSVELNDVKGVLLVNLIAFEQSQCTEEAQVLSGYASLMGMFVRTSRDVELLYRRGILAKPFTDEEEMARFFRHLADVSATNHDRQLFAVLCEDVRRYYYSWLHKNRPLEDSMSVRLLSVQVQSEQQGAQQFTIFRVPSRLRERNRTAYEPSMISIGPYFHGAVDLQAMEDQKWACLYSLLGRNAEINLPTLIQEMQSLEPRARACYSEQPALGSNDFVRMLLLDSSFILEFIINRRSEHVHDRRFNVRWGRQAILEAGWARSSIWIDLFFLLENQIPFFVHETLYNLIFDPPAMSWESFIRGAINAGESGGDTEIKHLLHLHYTRMLPTSSQGEGTTPACCTTYISGLLQGCRPPPSPNAHDLILPRATEMSEAGVTFKLRSSAQQTYDVAFDPAKGIMEIPKLYVGDDKWPELANLLAFEQTLGSEPWVLVNFVMLMSQMLRTAKDVELLRKRRILVNMLPDDEAAAHFFSHLCDGATVSLEVPIYKELYDDVQRYCDSWRHRSRAVLMRDYFGNPWAAISVVVAAILLALTAIQTYFAVFPKK